MAAEVLIWRLGSSLWLAEAISCGCRIQVLVFLLVIGWEPLLVLGATLGSLPCGPPPQVTSSGFELRTQLGRGGPLLSKAGGQRGALLRTPFQLQQFPGCHLCGLLFLGVSQGTQGIRTPGKRKQGGWALPPGSPSCH